MINQFDQNLAQLLSGNAATVENESATGLAVATTLEQAAKGGEDKSSSKNTSDDSNSATSSKSKKTTGSADMKDVDDKSKMQSADKAASDEKTVGESKPSEIDASSSKADTAPGKTSDSSNKSTEASKESKEKESKVVIPKDEKTSAAKDNNTDSVIVNSATGKDSEVITNDDDSEQESVPSKTGSTKKPKIVTDSSSSNSITEFGEDRLFSTRMQQSEEKGLTHWMLFSEGKNVYAYNVVNDDKVASNVLEIKNDVVTMAVDHNKGYLFVAHQDSEDSATVDRYRFTVTISPDVTNLAVNETSIISVHQGRSISSLAVDADQSILYIADRKSKRIDSIEYDDKVLEASNSIIGLTKTIYEQDHNLGAVSSIAVDYLGSIYWSVVEDGKQHGSIFKASADDPNTETVDVVSRKLDAAYGMTYRNDFLFFVGEDIVEAN